MLSIFCSCRIFRCKMASNTNRFIPKQWLEAAQLLQMQKNQNYHARSFSFKTNCNNAPFCMPSRANEKRWNSYNLQYVTTQGQQMTFMQQNENDCEGTYPGSHGVNRLHANAGKPKDIYIATSSTAQSEAGVEDIPNQRTKRAKHYHKYSETRDEYKQGRYFHRKNASSHHVRNDDICWRRGGSHCSTEASSSHGYQKQFHRRYKSDVPSISARPDRGAVDGACDADKNRFQLRREWEEILSSDIVDKHTSAKKNIIRIISYNILSQKLLELNSSLYDRCDQRILEWQYRWLKLQQEVEQLDADIMCLQEIEEIHYQQQILTFLDQLGYECHYKKRTGNNLNKPDGVLTAFKRAKFTLTSEKKVEYFRGHIPLVDQNNVGLITVLKPKFEEAESGYFCVANTHLLYNPKRGDIKLVQLSTLFAEIQQMVSHFRSDRIPIILCGDFNSTADSLLYEFIAKQHIYYEGFEARLVSGQHTSKRGRVNYLPEQLLPMCLNISDHCCFKPNENSAKEEQRSGLSYYLGHSLGPLKSVHDHGCKQASTTQDNGITVDFIFHTPSSLPPAVASASRESKHEGIKKNPGVTLQPVRRLSLVSPEELRNASYIPNAVHPSDHLPIVADFLLDVSS